AQLGDDAGVIGAALQALSATASTSPSVQPGRARRAVLVNGIPASGKSTVSRGIADRMGWPLLALDTVKNPFLEVLGGADREFNRTLGRASYQAIWSLVGHAPAGSTFIVDAWFGFQPRQVLEDHLRKAGVEHTVEFWCHAPGEVLAERYGARLGQRLPGHPGAAYIPELIELAKRAEPLRRGPLFDVDTTQPIDFDAIAAWLRATLASDA
ncbi:AAA family ATPase, partial [Mesorhizobium sp. Cs1321R2N1]|uniref:AAA family ATPase n=1 Tax=Mesorhizobium sp. Cs1321R2N1 TaxID=3015174 RepID=UPI00301BA1BA